MSQRLKYWIKRLSRKSPQIKKEPVISGSYIYNIICDDNLMRNGCMECFWSEAFCGRIHRTSRYGCVFNFILLINANKKDALLKHLLPIYTTYIYNIICDDNLMRNGCMECFWSEAYWQVRRNDENTESIVYRKLARKNYLSLSDSTIISK